MIYALHVPREHREDKTCSPWWLCLYRGAEDLRLIQPCEGEVSKQADSTFPFLCGSGGAAQERGKGVVLDGSTRASPNS